MISVHQKLNGTDSQRIERFLILSQFLSGSVKRRSCGSDFLDSGRVILGGSSQVS